MLVMIISAAVVLIVSATIKGTVTEIKINDRYMTRLKAKSAAESAGRIRSLRARISFHQ